MSAAQIARRPLSSEPWALDTEFAQYLPQALVNFGQSDRNLIAGGPAVSLVGTGALQRAANWRGPGLRFGDAAGATYYTVAVGAEAPGACTLIWSGHMLSGTTIGLRDTSSTGGFIPVWLNASQFDLRWRSDEFTAAGTWVVGNPACIVLTANGNTTKLWVDGRLIFSGTTAGATSIVSPWRLHKNGDSAVGCDAVTNIFATFARPIPDGLAAEISFDYMRLAELRRTFISLPTGGAALTQDTRFDNTNTFYGPTVTPGSVELTPGLFTNTNTFYSPTVTQADQALTQDTRFDNAQAFYAATVTPGAVALTPGLFTNTNTFYAPTVTSIYELIQASRFDNGQIFYGPTVTPGSSPLTQADRFDNSNTFYGATITGGAVVEVTAPTPAGGKRRRRERYVARFKGQDHEFESLEELEAFVQRARSSQAATPKRQRAPVRITLTPDFVAEVAETTAISIPTRMEAMPASVALVQARRIEAAYNRRDDEEEDEALLWLI